MTRQQLTERLEAAGHTVQPRVSASTTVLVAGDKAGSKLAAAKARGIPIWDEQQALAALLPPSEARKGE